MDCGLMRESNRQCSAVQCSQVVRVVHNMTMQLHAIVCSPGDYQLCCLFDINGKGR